MTNSKIENFINMTGTIMQDARSKYHLTLGNLIDFLGTCNNDMIIKIKHQKDAQLFPTMCTITNPHSYRGYYEDLAFEYETGKQTVKELLSITKKCVGKEFDGWKGGTFEMKKDTVLWISEEGCCSDFGIIDVISNTENNTIALIVKTVD
jgi:hypothetical protein